MPKTYTVKEVADILGFSTNSIYAFLKEKRIRGVRIGKGRFRIPEEELSRILHLSKKPVGVPVAAAPVASAEASATSVIGSSVDALSPTGDAVFIEPKYSDAGKMRGDLLAPNIFDWFIGLGALVAGVALFLFNTTFTAEELPRMTLLYPVIRIVLIACGFGVIISGVFSKAGGWRRVFHLTLSVLGFINAFGLIKSGDIEGGALYGAMAVMILLESFVRFGGIVAIGLYVSMIAILVPAVILFFPIDSHVSALSAMIGMPTLTMGIASLVVSIVLLILFWLGYAGNRRLFLSAAWLLTIGDVAVALWYAHLQYWSRSFFILVVGTFTALLPYWWPLQQQLSRRYKLLLHGLFVVIGAVFVLAVLVVYLLQQSIWTVREREALNKLHIAHTRITNATSSIQGSLEVASSNTDFVRSVSEPDIATLNKYSKIIYESNPNVRRLVFLDKNGQGIALYPYGTFDEPNFSYRDYFQQTKNTGKSYISDVFQAKSDQSGRFVVVIATPLFDAGAFSGVVTASMDLERIGFLLSQVAAGGQGEYFVVVDARGVILSHPNEKLIGSVVPSSDPLHRALKGEEGIVKGMLIEGMLGMMGYVYIPELRWAISLRAPAAKIFGLSAEEIWIVFGVVCVIIGVGITVISYMRNRAYAGKEGGP